MSEPHTVGARELPDDRVERMIVFARQRIEAILVYGPRGGWGPDEAVTAQLCQLIDVIKVAQGLPEPTDTGERLKALFFSDPPPPGSKLLPDDRWSKPMDVKAFYAILRNFVNQETSDLSLLSQAHVGR